MRSNWSKRFVLREIQKLKRAGSPLNVRAMKTHALYWHGLKFFGSWGKAIRSAGIDYDEIRKYRAWTKAIILEWIRSEGKKGRDLRSGIVERNEKALYTAACRRFGGWYPALRAAGIRGIEERTPRKWDPGKLIRALEKFGPEATYGEIRAKDAALLSVLRRYFGSFSRARKAAGFVPKLPRRRRLWPKEKILDIIRSRAKDHPFLRTRDFSDLGGMWTAAMEIFGSWPTAVRAAGYPYQKERRTGPYKWTHQAILQAIQARAASGKSLATSAVGPSLYQVARKEFGSWSSAIQAANVAPLEREGRALLVRARRPGGRR
jgi:hypothetical protein